MAVNSVNGQTGGPTGDVVLVPADVGAALAGGLLSVPVAGTGNIDLSASDSAMPVAEFTGTLSVDRLVRISAGTSARVYVVNNKTTPNGYLLRYGSVSGGATVLIPRDGPTIMLWNGTDMRLLAGRGGTVSVLDFGVVANATSASPTDIQPGVQAAVDALGLIGGGTIYFPPGDYYRPSHSPNNIVPKDNITFKGAGRGATTIWFDDRTGQSSFIFYVPKTDSYKLNNVKNISIIDMLWRGYSDTNYTGAGSAFMLLNYCNGVTIDNLGMLNARAGGLDIFKSNNVSISNFTGMFLNGGCLNLNDTANFRIDNVYIRGCGDDAISSNTSDKGPYPVRQGISVTNVVLEEAQGPTFAGLKHAVISNITMRRTLRKGLFIGRSADGDGSGQGNTSNHSISVSNITITDVIRFPYSAKQPLIGAGYYLYLAGAWRVAMPAAGVKSLTYVGSPMRPNASGIIGDLFGTLQGNFESNDTDTYVNDDNVTGITGPSIGMAGITFSNIVLQRTLPNVNKFSDWGYDPRGIYAPRYDGTPWLNEVTNPTYINHDIVDDVAMNSYPMQLAPSIIDALFSNIVCRVGSDHAVYFDRALSDESGDVVEPYAFDNIRFDNCIFKDFTNAGVFVRTPAVTPVDAIYQDVTFQGCVFDGDPRFTSINRVRDAETGIADGTWSGTTFYPIGASITAAGGFKFIECKFKNLKQSVRTDSLHKQFYLNNMVHMQAAAFGLNVGNRGVGTCPDGGAEFTVVWEQCDPRVEATFGSLLGNGPSISSSIPSAGYYLPGQFVAVRSPTIVSGKVLTGWRRLTFSNATASNQVSGVDWAPQYSTTT